MGRRGRSSDDIFQEIPSTEEEVRVFLDTSVLLSASASAKGASRFVLEEAGKQSWELISSYYCHEETCRNISKMGDSAVEYFRKSVEKAVQWHSDIVTSEKVVVFPKAKDKPVLLSALACESDVLLTLDREDFHGKLGKQFYGMAIRTPGDWLMELRDSGML